MRGSGGENRGELEGSSPATRRRTRKSDGADTAEVTEPVGVRRKKKGAGGYGKGMRRILPRPHWREEVLQFIGPARSAVARRGGPPRFEPA
ncbi:hypothetical protein E2562_033121 [Oryza meyeriana var. granulata]|uniref:Uncharacterized protein n=1 Tax=Oryza meyeriana var. granulata TaxID=110450 RepID=A0A6G1CK94_9ORYZ|nr:hypothetical protein E2562_033121 [Oryza meyeriana var. granulata]